MGGKISATIAGTRTFTAYWKEKGKAPGRSALSNFGPWPWVCVFRYCYGYHFPIFFIF